MDSKAVIELQNSIVFAITTSIGIKWDALVINIEIDEVEGEDTENCLALAFTKQRHGAWDRTSFELPYQCYDLFNALQQSSEGAERWKTCTLEIATNGKYKFSYCYEPPRRLTGIHDDQAMLKSYQPMPIL